MPTGDPMTIPAPMWPVTPQVVDVPLAIAGVMSALPPPGTQWPDVEKAKFMTALGAVLDLVYPTPGEPDGQ